MFNFSSNSQIVKSSNSQIVKSSNKSMLNVLCALITVVCMLCSCSSDDKDTPAEPQTYRNSLLVYIAAQNSLGYFDNQYTSASKLDSAEIVQAMSELSSTEDNVFLFIDDARKPRLYRLYRIASGTQRRTIITKIYAWPTDVCSADPATLCQTLTRIATDYPSENYGLVLWSHGSGWVASTNVQNTMKSQKYRPFAFGVDVGPGGDLDDDTDAQGNMGVQMDISDLAKAVSNSGVHLNYILFDACGMQNIETAYELRNVTDYVIGSTTSTSAYGCYYINLLPKLMAYPFTQQRAINIANQYFYDCALNPLLQEYYDNMGNVCSVIKTSELDNLAAATAQCVSKGITHRQTPSMDTVQHYLSTLYYDAPEDFDMGSAIHHLAGETLYQQWRNAADQCIIASNFSSKYIIAIVGGQYIYNTPTDLDHAVGVSMFVPRDLFEKSPYTNYNLQFRRTAWYSAAKWSLTGW